MRQRTETPEEFCASDEQRGRRLEKDNRFVLVVDDDDEIRELIAALLRSEGYDAVELADGLEALNYLAAAEVFGTDVRTPDLVVADILMPTFSGLDLLAGMRENELGPPVMLVTGVTDEDVRREGRRLGATCVVSKPFDVPMFLDAVDDSIGAPGVAAAVRAEWAAATAELDA